MRKKSLIQITRTDYHETEIFCPFCLMEMNQPRHLFAWRNGERGFLKCERRKKKGLKEKSCLLARTEHVFRNSVQVVDIRNYQCLNLTFAEHTHIRNKAKATKKKLQGFLDHDDQLELDL